MEQKDKDSVEETRITNERMADINEKDDISEGKSGCEIYECNKKSSKLPIIVGIVIFLLIVSMFAYPRIVSKFLPDSYYTYNNFEFRKISGLWVTEIYNQKTETVYRLPLHYGPKELEDVEFNENIVAFLKIANAFKDSDGNSATYVTYDPDINDSQISLAYYELSQHLGTALNIQTYPTVTHDVEYIENETIKTCNKKEPVIYLKYQSPAYVDLQGPCLIIQGEGTDLVKAANKALYVFYNIMD